MHGRRGLDRWDPCKEHETVPGWIRILWARATGLLAARLGVNTGCGMGWGHGARTGVCGTARTTNPWNLETTGRGDWAGDGMWQRGTGHGKGWETDSAQEQPCGIGEPVTMEW